MGDELFTKLRKQLDQYSSGFPATDSGVELRILRKLFTEEEASMFLNMSLAAEAPDAVARRTGRDPKAVADLLDRMAEKGLLFRLRKEGESRYAAAAFVVGIYEFQLNRMDRDLAEMMDQYMHEAYGRRLSSHTVQMRTVPVGRSVNVSWPVAPYEDLQEIIRSKDRIAVANCICRLQKGLLEQACDKPLEVCFSFGSHAQYYVDRGMGRWVDQEEALAILKRSEEAGLVPQPFNAQNPGGMCNCCGDCCGMLVALKKHPKPAHGVITNYFAEVDPDQCTACETCLERCQMDAVAVGADGVAVVDRDRCIGCGLCVTTCPAEALSLKPISSERRRVPPASAKETLERIARERGTSLVPLAFGNEAP